jgi:hypothetical protein
LLTYYLVIAIMTGNLEGSTLRGDTSEEKSIGQVTKYPTVHETTDADPDAGLSTAERAAIVSQMFTDSTSPFADFLFLRIAGSSGSLICS